MKQPSIHKTAWIAPGAAVRGAVTLEENTSVWYNAVVRADAEPILVGKNSNIQDCAVLHVDQGHPLTVGESVTVGHGAILHGCTVEDEALIGMGAVILNGAIIGAGSIVGAGALVTAGTVLPENSLAIGSPARVVRQVRPEEREATLKNARQYVAESRSYAAEEKGTNEP